MLDRPLDDNTDTMKYLHDLKAFDATMAVIAVYLIGMACLALRGFMLKARAKDSGGSVAEMNYHFLAGSQFNWVVIFLNFCAQYIGGIVMIQAPQDTKTYGYFMFTWILATAWCGGSSRSSPRRV